MSAGDPQKWFTEVMIFKAHEDIIAKSFVFMYVLIVEVTFVEHLHGSKARAFLPLGFIATELVFAAMQISSKAETMKTPVRHIVSHLAG